MMQSLKIEIDYNHLYGYTIFLLVICYVSLAVVYAMFGYYSFVINKANGMMAQYVSYVIINSTFAMVTIQFQVFMYSVYMRFSTLNSYVE